MNKSELIEKIAAGSGLTKADSKKALDAAMAAIKGALKKGDKVALVGFGTSVLLVLVSILLQRQRLRLLLRKLLSSRLVQI